MIGRLGWFLLGFAGGVIMMAVLRGEKEEEKDFDSIADELTKRFKNLESSEAV